MRIILNVSGAFCVITTTGWSPVLSGRDAEITFLKERRNETATKKKVTGIVRGKRILKKDSFLGFMRHSPIRCKRR
jgi:hypothetical protein